MADADNEQSSEHNDGDGGGGGDNSRVEVALDGVLSAIEKVRFLSMLVRPALRYLISKTASDDCSSSPRLTSTPTHMV